MDPSSLIGPPSPLGYPAPYWFMAGLKVLGFVLHMIPMNLWFAGILVALLLRRWGGEHARRFSDRLMSQMPILIALGINFGIVPLLFTQVAYHRVFYPATILMGWFWFSIVGLLVVAYYGVYVYAVGLRGGRLRPRHAAAGWTAAVLFVVMGFIFSHAFTLMVNVEAWPGILERTAVGGAPTGTALNVGDPQVLPRWLMVFGLALTTTAAYAIVDAAFFAVREPEAYRRWIARFALGLYTVGIGWFATAGSWYAFGTWIPEVRALMFGPLVLLTALTALGPGLVWVLVAAQRRGVRPRLALTAAAAQVAVLALNGVSRQVVQNAELRRFLDVAAGRVEVQWSPLVLFVVLFVAGLAVAAWMVVQALRAAQRPAAARG
ncbi:MAG: hypothetical protein QN159_03660 [Armatimonadota bacterium]|nr:hypothetical protein [Armatimonadota bacterium]